MVKIIIIAISVITAITNVLIIACTIKNQKVYSYSSKIGWPFVTIFLLIVGIIAMEIQTTIDNKDMILRAIVFKKLQPTSINYKIENTDTIMTSCHYKVDGVDVDVTIYE